jgi:hypothetical protein
VCKYPYQINATSRKVCIILFPATSFFSAVKIEVSILERGLAKYWAPPANQSAVSLKEERRTHVSVSCY